MGRNIYRLLVVNSQPGQAFLQENPRDKTTKQTIVFHIKSLLCYIIITSLLIQY